PAAPLDPGTRTGLFSAFRGRSKASAAAAPDAAAPDVPATVGSGSEQEQRPAADEARVPAPDGGAAPAAQGASDGLAASEGPEAVDPVPGPQAGPPTFVIPSLEPD